MPLLVHQFSAQAAHKASNAADDNDTVSPSPTPCCQQLRLEPKHAHTHTPGSLMLFKVRDLHMLIESLMQNLSGLIQHVRAL